MGTFIRRWTACEKASGSIAGAAGGILSVNLVARKPEKRTPQTNSYTRKFLLNSPWQPQSCAVFAGALRYPRYSWYDRFMIRLIMKMTGVKRIPAKKWSIPTGNRYPGLLGKSHKWRANSA